MKQRAWGMWGVAVTFVLFQFGLQLSSGQIVDGLMQSFALTAFGGGLLASVYYYIYVLLQAPAGFLIDKYGVRRLLAGGALTCGLGCFLFGGAPVVWLAALGRLLMGLGAAFAFVGTLNIVGRWFSSQQFTVMAALSETLGMLGAIGAAFSLATAVHYYGWRVCMIGAGCGAVGLSILLWCCVRDRKLPPLEMHLVEVERFWQTFKWIVRNPVLWLAGLYSGVLFSVITVFVALWGIPFFMRVHGWSIIQSTLMCNLVFLGVAMGGPVLGWLDARVSFRRTLFVLESVMVTVLLTVLLWYPTMPIGWLVACLLSMGIFASGYILIFGVGNEAAPPARQGSAMGFINMLSVLTAPLFQPLVGGILTYLAGERVASNLFTVPVRDFQQALMVLPVLTLCAAVLALKLPAK
ncbi:MAG: hypothetical protein A3J38_08530 [Gammaproteobacteria bacterium RIFCSPHIGHO2_12_FULL_45_9]|nr:MAG: hypothetical protein A3J38_08530 [Gammaproteobacteria bacterium RIFCSPHIGHO2_12_FULL_45_9]